MDSVVYTQIGDSIECADQYQVEIPMQITKRHYALCKETPIDTDSNSSCRIFIGLPIPIMQITEKIENPRYQTPTFSDLKSIKEGKDLNLEVVPVEMGPGYCLVPGTNGDSWSKIEMDSFVLGLYVFEKNFVQVKRFVGSKKMEDILAFYYGKFYRSVEYQKWSVCRKSKSKKFVCGKRMFIGQRQQELLWRLLARVSKESQSVLVEVSNTYNEGNISLEEYVSTLKSVVGLNILIEALGIRKGKQNLTSQTPDTSKSTQISKNPSKIPIGKSCSSLTPQQIIQFLTGDYRLSKARSNDLFWEAVWPILLAQGWHSEESGGSSYYAVSTSKHSLVFLVPGVHKFSRELMKGTHYFDSVADVLSIVASNPYLLEVDKNEGSTVKLRQLCYLQPRTPCGDADVIKFDVTDTCQLACRKTCNTRELSSVSLEISKSGSCESSDITECAKPVILDQEMNCSDFDNLKSLKKRKVGRPKRNQDCSSVHKFSSLDSSNDCPIETHQNLDKKPQPTKPLFDLNLPPLPEVDVPEPELNSVVVPVPEPELNCRRQGKRNRPPTAKALEALANGLLTRNRRQKNDGAICTRASDGACTGSSASGPGATGPSNGNVLMANGDACGSGTMNSFGNVLYMLYESENN